MVEKNSLNRLIRCVCGKKIGPDPRNFNQRVSLGRNDLLIRTFLSTVNLRRFVMRQNVALGLHIQHVDIMVSQIDNPHPTAGRINDYRGG